MPTQPTSEVYSPMPTLAKLERIEELLRQDKPLWIRLRDDPCVYRYGGRGWGGNHTALLQGDPDHHGRRYNVAVKYVDLAEIRSVIAAPDQQAQQGNSLAGLPGVMDMPEFAVQAGYRYTSGLVGAVRTPR